MALLNLPRHVLINIFERLGDRQLLESRAVNRKWKSIVDDEGLWLKKFNRQLRHSPFWSDSHSYSWKERYFLARNWLRGNINRCKLLDLGKKYIPWLHLCPVQPRDYLWFSWGSKIRRLSLTQMERTPPSKRQRHDTAITPTMVSAGQVPNDDFCRFVITQPSSSNGDEIWIAAGTRNGVLHYSRWTPTDGANSPSSCYQAHDSDLHCVDLILDSSLAITGSRDRTVKIWNVPAFSNDASTDPTLKSKLNLGDRAWCLKVDQRNCSQLAVGSAACWNDCAPLTLWDIERGRLTGQLGVPCKRGAGVLDLIFMSDHSILSTGYDSIVRLWDLRTPSGSCVWSWEETYDSTIYCLSSDHNNAVFAGTSRYGLVWLLDTRQRRALQHYYIGSDNRSVYSLVATTRGLHVGLDDEIWSLHC